MSEAHGKNNNPRRKAARRSARRWTGFAAAAAVAAAAALILPSVQWSDSARPAATVNAAAALALNKAAESIRPTDLQVPAGKYLYIREEAWWATSQEDKYLYLQKNILETWIPADWHDEWVQKRRFTGDIKWIYGTPADVPSGQLTELPVPAVMRGTCGMYYPEAHNLCDAEGRWDEPTLPWLKRVPKTATGIYESLFNETDSPGKPEETPVRMLRDAAGGLKSGLLPAAVRADLFRAMANIPGIRITDAATDLDGRTGIGFAVTSPSGISEQIVIDVNTGTFLGERDISTAQDGRTPAGTESSRTAVYFGIADGPGRPPAR